MNTIVGEIRIDTMKIWSKMPDEILRLLEKQEILQPAGNIVYAESITRETLEIIWIYLEGYKKQTFEEKTVRQGLNIILDHLALRLGGFHELLYAAKIIQKASDEVLSCTKNDLVEIIEEVRLYISRYNLWLDLLIPWYDLNVIIRNKKIEILS